MMLMKRGLMIFAAWTAVALLFPIQMSYQTSSSAEPRTWSWILAWQLTGWWSWAVFTPPVWAFSAWAVRIRRPAQLIAAHLPMAVATAVLCAALEGGAKWALGLYRTPHTFLTGMGDAVAMYWTFNLLVYAMVAGLYHAWRAERRGLKVVQAGLAALAGPPQPRLLFHKPRTDSAFWCSGPNQCKLPIAQ